MPHRHQTLGLLLGLLAVCLFGGSLPATRAAVAGFDPWFVTAARAAIGGLVAIVPFLVARPRFPRERLGTLVTIALCLIVGFPAALALASVTVPAAHGGVILGLLPLATAIAAVFVTGERPSLAFWMLSLAGAALVVAFALREGDLVVVSGDVYLAVAIALTGIGYAFSAKLSRTLPAWEAIGWPLLLTLPFALIVSFLSWPTGAGAAPASAWIGLAYLGIVSQFVAYAVWNAALSIGGVARIGQLQLLQPFITFALSAVFLGETITATMIGFALAVALVVALGRRVAIARRGG